LLAELWCTENKRDDERQLFFKKAVLRCGGGGGGGESERCMSWRRIEKDCFYAWTAQ
jgi:hypothetical protein